MAFAAVEKGDDVVHLQVPLSLLLPERMCRFHVSKP